MSKKPSEDLFQLIRSLNRNEKGYFKKLVSLHTVGEKNNYVRLFDAIDHQPVYNEDEILEKELYIRQLPLLKNYLYKTVLDSLENYHATNSAEIRLHKMMSEITILHNKALYDQCLKLIRQAKKLAYKYEKYASIIDMIQWERLSIGNDLSLDLLDSLLEEEEEALKKLNNAIHFARINSSLYAVFRNIGYARNEKDIERINKIMDDPQMSDENNALSFTAQYNFLKVKSLYYFMLNDWQESLDYRLRLMKLFEEKHPEFITEYPTAYVGTLNNVMISCYLLLRKKEFFSCLQKLRMLSNNTAESEVTATKARIFLTTSNLELNWHFRTGDFIKGIALAAEIEKELIIYRNKITKSAELELYFNIAKVFFGNAQYDKALHWLNRLFNHEDINLLPELYFNTAKILSIIIHLELGNSDFLDYLIKSTQRQFQSHRKKFRFETMMLSFFQRINKKPEPSVVKKEYLQLKLKLEELKGVPLENKIFDHFDFISWAESKTENLPLADIFKRKLPQE